MVGTFLVALVSFLGLKKAVLEVSHLDVAFIVQLVDAAVEDDFESIHFRESTLFLVSKLVDKFTQPQCRVSSRLDRGEPLHKHNHTHTPLMEATR